MFHEILLLLGTAALVEQPKVQNSLHPLPFPPISIRYYSCTKKNLVPVQGNNAYQRFHRKNSMKRMREKKVLKELIAKRATEILSK